MSLPPSAILLVTTLVAAVSAVLIGAAWRTQRDADSLLWWCASLATAAVAFLLFYLGGDAPDAAPRMLANYVMLIAAGAGFCAVRRQNGDPPLLIALVIGPILWLAASAKVGDDFILRVTITSLLHGLVAVASSVELARRSAGRPATQRWMAGIVGAFAIMHFVRAATGPNIVGNASPDAGLNGAWVMPVGVVASLYIVVIAVFAFATIRTGGQPRDASPWLGSRSRQA